MFSLEKALEVDLHFNHLIKEHDGIDGLETSDERMDSNTSMKTKIHGHTKLGFKNVSIVEN